MRILGSLINVLAWKNTTDFWVSLLIQQNCIVHGLCELYLNKLNTHTHNTVLCTLDYAGQEGGDTKLRKAQFLSLDCEWEQSELTVSWLTT